MVATALAGPPPVKRRVELPQGVVVSVLQEGDGQHFPQKLVVAHVVGRLPSGCVFESTEGKGQPPMTMLLGKKAIIPGMELGLKELSLGSIAEIHIPADLGYGDKGVPHIVPPSSDLLFEVQLLEVDGTQSAAQSLQSALPTAAKDDSACLKLPWWLARVESLPPSQYYINFCRETAAGHVPPLLESARSIARRTSTEFDCFDVGKASEPFIVVDMQEGWPAQDTWDLSWLAGKLGHTRQLVKWLGPIFTRQENLWEAPVYETSLSEYADYVRELERLDPDCKDENAASCPRLYLNGWPAFAQLPWLRSYVVPGGEGIADAAASADMILEDLNSLLIRESEALRESLLEGLTARGSYQPPDAEEQKQKLQNEDWDLTKVFISPKGAITRLHFDNGGAHAWLSQMEGRKMFVCFPPSTASVDRTFLRDPLEPGIQVKRWYSSMQCRLLPLLRRGLPIWASAKGRLKVQGGAGAADQRARHLWLLGVGVAGAAVSRHGLQPVALQAPVDRAELIYKIQQGDVAAVLKALADAVGGIDEPLTSIGQTALHIACAAGTLPLVTALLKAGANASARDRTGASCVALASTAGHAHVLEKLLEVEDIALETYDVAGLTPLHKAVGFGHPGCLRRLLENGGMDPNICTGEVTIPAEFEPAPSRYETALHVASRLLTRAINSPDGAGSSEQQQEQQREIMQILVDYGADPTAKDINGDTPLHFCARNGDSWGLALLLGNTVEPTEALRIRNKEGRDDGEHLHPFEGDEGLMNGSWLDPLDPDVFEKWPDVRRATPYTAVVERGETIVAPKGWWHYAVSLDTSVTIMRNFYSTSNQWDLIQRKDSGLAGAIATHVLRKQPKLKNQPDSVINDIATKTVHKLRETFIENRRKAAQQQSGYLK
ncbi:FK506-binding protein 1 [Symbiodinium microadriaticum]|uniref:peptidylprolyl isomerase n=1 Tax=Symbiodinium microadriaticum TaxID=2951 RepID=A0A1Q9CG58_SYMMI|nr:FK506-binding protein 1 [Symbiodinium microadriaticum]